MWIETDHHGLVNLRYIKRIDLAGDIEQETFGIYLFDGEGVQYPIVDLPRFANIGIFQGKETNQEIHVAVYTFYNVAKTLIAKTKDKEIITIEAIYKEFASEWYAQQKKEMIENEQSGKQSKNKKPEENGNDEQEQPPVIGSGKVHHFSDMKQFLDAYSDSYFTKFQKKPLLRYETEGKMAGELVKLYPLEKLKTMLTWYFDSTEDFITKANYDIKTFIAILERTRKVGGEG
jgi:hypothetical protein